MSEDKKYNGWTNYETWNIALWLGNDQGSQEAWEERARECYKWASDRGVGLTKEEAAVCDLAGCLKEDFEEGMANLLDTAKASASVWADLLGAALSEVNWQEIAQHYIDDVDKAEEEEEATEEA